MPKYTTGEMAKLCGVSVRTVQYYDTRGILTPAELSEGGRRLYSDSDLQKMKIICFLREAGFSINNISELLSGENTSAIISLLLEQQKRILLDEVNERQTKLAMLEQLSWELKRTDDLTVESIGDIAHRIRNGKKLKRLHVMIVIMGLPLNLIQWITIFLWITKGTWLPFVLWIMFAVVYSLWLMNYYFRRVAYICPQCHAVFKPSLKDAFFARHTRRLRKLRCTRCGHRGFCVEVYEKEEKDE